MLLNRLLRYYHIVQTINNPSEGSTWLKRYARYGILSAGKPSMRLSRRFIHIVIHDRMHEEYTIGSDSQPAYGSLGQMLLWFAVLAFGCYRRHLFANRQASCMLRTLWNLQSFAFSPVPCVFICVFLLFRCSRHFIKGFGRDCLLKKWLIKKRKFASVFSFPNLHIR